MVSEYKCRYSPYAMGLTISLNIAGAGYLCYQISRLIVHPENKAAHWAELIAVAVLMLYFFLIHPQSIIVDNTALVIRKFIGSRRIDAGNISSISLINYDDMNVTFRLFASGGFWGFLGYFFSFRYKVLRLYATNLDNLLLIKTNSGKKIVISPENPDKVVSLVTQFKVASGA